MTLIIINYDIFGLALTFCVGPVDFEKLGPWCPH